MHRACHFLEEKHTLHWMKGRKSTKMGMRVRTMKSRKSHRARPPTFLRAISFTWRLSQYHWLPSCLSKQTRITFSASHQEKTQVSLQTCASEESCPHPAAHMHSLFTHLISKCLNSLYVSKDLSVLLTDSVLTSGQKFLW